MKNKRNRKMIYKCIKLIKTYKINILIRISDRKTLYIKIDQKNITNTNTLSVCLPHPPNASNIDTPLPGCLSVISVCLLKYQGEIISNTKVVRNGLTNPDTPTTRVSDVH